MMPRTVPCHHYVHSSSDLLSSSRVLHVPVCQPVEQPSIDDQLVWIPFFEQHTVVRLVLKLVVLSIPFRNGSLPSAALGLTTAPTTLLSDSRIVLP